MVATSTDTNGYSEQFSRFDRRVAGQSLAWLRDIRRRAFDRFSELGFPSTRQEEWRFTYVRPITRQTFDLAPLAPLEVAHAALEATKLEGDFHRLVFINGRFAPQLSTDLPLSKGAVVGSLSQVAESQAAVLQEALTRNAPVDATFTALNTAFLEDGVFVYLPDDMVIEKPIQLVYISHADERPSMTHPRNLIVLRRQSQATIVERYTGLKGGSYFTNAVTEAVLGESAALDHHKLQQETGDSFHIATTQVHQSQHSQFSSHYVGLGAALARNELNCVLDGEGIESQLRGIYLAGGKQHMDNRTRIDHAKPNCNSFELYKGILDERSHGVFNGKIYVHADAQKTDAKQSNQVLLLSDDAMIDTKPQLEIYADDVKCTHGATVGNLDEQALYYLRSRGVPLDLARSMLIFAFANEVVQDISVEPVRRYVENILSKDRGLPEL